MPILLYAMSRGTTAAAEYIKHWEGYVDHPVWDYHQYTIGYGTRYQPGMPVPMTKAFAAQLLAQVLRDKYMPETKLALARRGLDWNALTQAQRTAVLSFAYNLGAGAISSASWPERIKHGDMAGAKASWLAHSNAGGRPLEGLVKRRHSEWELYTTGRVLYDPPGWRAYYERKRQ